MVCGMGDEQRAAYGTAEGKARDVRLRLTAERRGYRLEKSRRKDRLALDWGYQLIRIEDGHVLRKTRAGYGLTMDEIEAFMNGYNPAGLRFSAPDSPETAPGAFRVPFTSGDHA
jgi:hypothetical protein